MDGRMDRWVTPRELELERDERTDEIDGGSQKLSEHNGTIPVCVQCARLWLVSGVCFGPVEVQPDSCGDAPSLCGNYLSVCCRMSRSDSGAAAAAAQVLKQKCFRAANYSAPSARRDGMYFSMRSGSGGGGNNASPTRVLWKDLDKGVRLIHWHVTYVFPARSLAHSVFFFFFL